MQTSKLPPTSSPARPASAAAQELEIPLELCCPITLDLFSDPVTVPESNQRYERSAIERAFLIDKRCPLTRIAASGVLTPDMSMRRSVDDFIKANPNRGLKPLAELRRLQETDSKEPAQPLHLGHQAAQSHPSGPATMEAVQRPAATLASWRDAGGSAPNFMFAPDDRGGVRLWDRDRGGVRLWDRGAALPGGGWEGTVNRNIPDVAFSPDGRVLASGR